MAGEHFPNDGKTFDIALRAFHRINSPTYDVAVDRDATRTRSKRPPSGLARESGARGPEAFQDSGFLASVTKLVGKLLKPLIATIPVVGLVSLAVDEFIKKLTGTSPIDLLISELGKLISSGVEGGLFARYMRSIPAWVPVGRKGYEQQFTYVEDGAARETTKEEEREVEGILSGSYGLHNDTVFTQWSHFHHWSFQVMPTPGHRYLVGRGNIPDPNEVALINQNVSASGAPRFEEILNIYGQLAPNADRSASAIECIMDVGAISKPPGDRGSAGVMFNDRWPYWPMTGDYFWATGRWAYDCMRGVANSPTTEVFPTQINPIKAFATARFEGFRFVENAFHVPATRFFFFATEKGGYIDFQPGTDRKGKQHESGIVLDDRDYEFIVDLPPQDRGKSPYPVGATIEFPFNSLVLRPRLLMFVNLAPFDANANTGPTFADDLEFVNVTPKIEVLRPKDPDKRPDQARITIPLKGLAKASGAKKHRAVGLDISLGWHDPNNEDARTLFKVNARIRKPDFISQSGDVRLATCINGRWRMLSASVSSVSADTPVIPARPTADFIHVTEMFLPIEAPLSVTTSGTWHHGFGEFMEENTLEKRTLEVGGLLADVNDETKKKMKKLIDDLRKTAADLRKTAADVKDPKRILRAELQKRIDELKRNNTDPRAVKALEDQLNALVNGLPDTPDAFQAALGELDKRLVEFSDALGALEDFLKITDDLIGERFKPGWHEDIDAAVLTDKKEESKRVSAIARTMFLKPTPFVTKADEPMGWMEFVDTNRRQIGRKVIGTIDQLSADRSANVRFFVESGQRDTRLGMRAPRISSIGSGNNLAERINPPEDRRDYQFMFEVTITPQVP